VRALRLAANPLVHAPALGLLLGAVTLGGMLSAYHAFLATVTLVYVIAALGLNVTAGFLGQLSLGQGAAFGVGAYVAAVLTLDHDWPVAFTLLAGFAAGALLGTLIAVPAARLGLIGVAMVSLGTTLVLTDVVLALHETTGGAAGRAGIIAPLWPGGELLSPDGITILVIVCAVVVYLLHWAYRISTLGRASLAVRGNRIGAAALGISAYWYTVLGFALGTGVGSLAGVLYCYAQSVVAPDAFTAALSILFLLMVVLGGAGTRVGPVIGGAVIGLLPILLSRYPSVSQYVYGGLLIVLVRVLPRGLIPTRGAKVPRGHLGGTRRAVAAERKAPNGETCLALDSVSRHFGGVYAARDVTLELARGEVLAIVGANGSGKTTVLNVVSGFYAPQTGTVDVRGHRVNGLGPHRIAARGVGRTFQVPQLFGDLTVDEHLALARRQGDRGRPDVVAAAEDLLERCGFIGAALTREARLFSHGEQRFLEICMALLRAPDVLLLDEPAAGLSQREIELLREMVEYASELGIGIIVVEHHHDFVRDIADRILVMHLGAAVWCGPPAEFDSSADVRRAYLGAELSLTEGE
jgi:branched-chain amino acid transport system permease protein